MTTTEKAQAGYVLGRTEEEYQRLRAQARTWEAVTSRVLDAVGLSPGASCLDAGCGPGETMRLMAQRVGPAGRVRGVDVDASLGAQAETMLHAAGHEQCSFVAHDLTCGAEVPGAPFDVVYARLLLSAAAPMIAAVYRSVLPAAVSFGLTSTEDGQQWLSDFDLAVREGGYRTGLWPLLIAAWKRKPGGPA